jgi:predicted nucleic acid-binding protein
MKNIFVDTSAWYALVDADDSDHKAAAAFHTGNTIPLVTTNALFSETLTLIRYRIGIDAALTFGQMLKASSFIRIVTVTPADEEHAWSIFSKYRDQDFSFTDCTSFAVMQRMKLDTAFTFDHHFSVMNFIVAPYPVYTKIL